ncbi:MAG: FAD-dependent oxidoreductase [Tissierellia bacterium]|nr:FAD-dependent oxidoreductase [Tissierellia bacterium]
MEFFETKIIDIVKETSDSYSFKMEIPEGFTWEAGQYTMWKFGDHQVEEGDRPVRIFTIASAPEDGYLMFTTRIADPHTSWKDILLHKLQVGDKMLVADPKGDFNFHGNYKESFVIAGGIGITPIRSLLKHFSENNKDDHKLVVLYSDDRGEFCYKRDFKEIVDKMPNLELIYISDRDKFTEEVKKYAEEKQNNAEYLIAGSPGMNKAFSEQLQSYGVKEENIKLDNFMGY